MLSPVEKRCVLQILESYARLLADPKTSKKFGISPVNVSIPQMAADVLTAAPQGDYAPDGREHVFILDEWADDSRRYAGRDPLAGCPGDVLTSMNDADLAVYLQEVAAGKASLHTWGIPRKNSGDGVAELRARLMPPRNPRSHSGARRTR